jgi:hypothetical protein
MTKDHSGSGAPPDNPTGDAPLISDTDLPPLADDVLDDDGQIARQAIDYLDNFESDAEAGDGDAAGGPAAASVDLHDLIGFDGSFLDDGSAAEPLEIFSDVDNMEEASSWIDGASPQVSELEMPALDMNEESLLADDAGRDGPLKDDPVLIETSEIESAFEEVEEAEDIATVMERLGLDLEEDPAD